MHTPSVDPTERLFSPQTVCVWATGVYLARALLGPSIPNTKAEVYALARDSGAVDPVHETGNFTKLAYGMAKRYGLKGLVYEVDAEAKAKVLAAALKGPHAVGLAGNQLNLTPHWQSGSIGHAIAVIYEHGTTGIQYDPLAPAGYAGDPFGPSELAKFATAAIIFKEEVVVINLEKFPDRGWNITGSVAAPAPVGVFSFNPASGFKLVKTDQWTKNSGANADQRASADGNSYLHVTNGGYQGLWVKELVGKVELSKAPVVYTKEQLDAAVAAVPKGYSEDDLRSAKKVAADIVAHAASNEASKF
jgi:hypothetical protein